MKSGKKTKKRRMTRAKGKILQNNLMKRFVRDIEREELLDSETLKTILMAN